MGITIQNQKGQAVLEYVLLIFMVLIVSLAILIGLARSTQRFFHNYYGQYFECLLETGELPSLGADGNAETECDDLYEPFTVTDGRAPIDGKSGGSRDDANKNSDKDSDQDASDQANAEGSGGGGSAEYRGPISAGAGAFGSDAAGRSRKVPLSKADRGGGAGDDEDGSDGTVRYNNFRQNNDFGSDGSGRSEYVPVYGTMAGEEEEEKKSSAQAKAPVAQDPEQALRGKRVPAKSETKKDNKEVDVDGGMDFPDFMRFLIIAVIILVIIIFFGGQVMQYQKSKD